MFGIGGWELIVIFAVILLLFGAKRLPEIARSMGKAVNEFKKGKDDFINSCEEYKTSETSTPPKTSKD
jgi:sec-independent protein translocase protein TatA